VDAGKDVASHAGRNIKKTVLELGGSDPFIVMPSADVDEAAKVGVKARIINNGQSCIAAKRFIVHRDVYRQFERSYVEGMRQLRVGDPMLEDTDLGPLSTAEGRGTLEKQMKENVAAGTRVLLGGKRIQGKGYFFEPTVVVDPPPSAPAANDEMFGPIATLFRADSAEHAIQIANSTQFGLGASVWTSERSDQLRFRDEIEAGMVFFNAVVASDTRIPFGGVKNSGYGRELSAAGLREFVNVKTVWVAEPKTETVVSSTE
jgi:succinate-semialdehyde dehydrogenase/glutarate-semialdehyde dehydrogenase